MILRGFTIFFLFYLFELSQCQESICTINGMKALQKVDEKFLSFSIDPAVLLAGLNLSDNSLRLAKHLSPAFIRIAGPSTQFVKYVDNEEKSKGDKLEETTNVIVTPSMWFGINEWLTLANLTPVFGINDIETSKGLWNPKSTLPLLELSDKLNVSCFWQMGFDSSRKTEQQYKQDINIFRHILDAFPERRDIWKIIGSDLSRIQKDHPEIEKRILEDLNEAVEAVMWEPESVDELNFPPKDVGYKLLMHQSKSNVPLWTTVPRNSKPLTFESALIWAEQVGEAAKMGYKVVFRQPRLHEMFSDTPSYWFSLIHKKLMGSLVLDVRNNHFSSEASVFAHCTKKQNSFVRRGAMTVLIVNNGTEPYKTLLRLPFSQTKTTEVQSYILTGSEENDKTILLNDEKLTPELLIEDKITFVPKLRRAKINKPVALQVPAKSIGFFTLPSARIQVCVSDEQELNLLLEEINEDQNLPLSQEIVLEQRQTDVGAEKRKSIFKDIRKDDEKFHKRQAPKYVSKSFDDKAKKIRLDARNFFIERAKFAEKHGRTIHKKPEIVQKIEEEPRRKDKDNSDLQLSSSEIQTILKNRAKSKAAKKNIIFTSEELDELVGKASKKYTNRNYHKRDINMKLLELKSRNQEKRDNLLKSPVQAREDFQDRMKKLLNSNKRISKREINLDMLKIKADGLKSNKFTQLAEQGRKSKSKFRNQEEKEATIRESDQTSAELLEELETEEKSDDNEKSHLPTGEIYAELAEESSEEIKPRKSSRKKSRKNNEEDRIQILTESDEFNDFEEDFPCIHEYFGSDVKPRNNFSPKIEFGETTQPKIGLNEKKSKKKSSKDISSEEFDHEIRRRDVNDQEMILHDKNAEEIFKTKNRKKLIYKQIEKLGHKKKLKQKIGKEEIGDELQKNVPEVHRIKRSLKDKQFPIQLFGHYQPLTKDIKEWKPSDLRNLKRNVNYYKEFQPKIEKPNSINYIAKISKRSIRNSLENEIDSFLNDIEKDTKFIHPKIDTEKGDYQLILPNADKFEINNDQGDTNIQYIHHNKIEKNKQDDDKIDVTFKNIEFTTVKSKNNIGNIQKIPSKEEEAVMRRFFQHLTGFFRNIGEKVKSCFNHFVN